jgi:hypothetical protein
MFSHCLKYFHEKNDFIELHHIIVQTVASRGGLIIIYSFKTLCILSLCS